ncbi:MAG: LamG domain-containing protein [Bacteroidales bacterium]|nr:LamG domain-containing protein [Bacteroidales bacterium]
MNRKLLVVTTLFIFSLSLSLSAQNKLASWSFEQLKNRVTPELISGRADTLEGNFEAAGGISGQGIRLDGFTTCVRTVEKQNIASGNEVSLEAWVALGNYPWNWCPVLTTETNETKGYRLLVGPLGQASFECAIGEQWISCSSGRDALPLRTWHHLVAVYKANQDIKLYINGVLVSSTQIHGSMSVPRSDYLLGMVAFPEKPSDIHRTWGTIASYFGLDGILDEVSIFDSALTDEQIKNRYNTFAGLSPDIAPRHLPRVENNPSRFGAYYTKLKYYPGWDNVWPVAGDPDIVVTFEKSPIKLIFWRGTRYGASWVSENDQWMSDQSVEAWGVGDEDNEGCFEHMQDRHCRFSHVRIIENTDARVVVHWRYAPVSAYNNTWRVDPKTGWECWIDEYYYIYPDASAIRKVSWKKGTLGYPRQFQETLALLQPGQVLSDLLEVDFTQVADYEGNRNKQSFVEDPNNPPYGPLGFNKSFDYTIQQYGFKSVNKPYICFDPGNEMFLRNARLSDYNLPRGCNHFPVGQARCDGRTTRTADRPSHATSFPISEPVIHEDGDRYYWNGLYGMNDMDLSQLISAGRSWAYAPEVEIRSGRCENMGYQTSERCYQLRLDSKKASSINLVLHGSEKSPVHNPALLISDWDDSQVKVLVNGKKFRDYRWGIIRELDGDRLVLFFFIESKQDTDITIIPNSSKS